MKFPVLFDRNGLLKTERIKTYVVDIKEVTKDEAKVVFEVEMRDFVQGKPVVVNTFDVRAFDDTLWEPEVGDFGGPMSVLELQKSFLESSITLDDQGMLVEQKIDSMANYFLIVGDRVYRRTSIPRYGFMKIGGETKTCITFGFGSDTFSAEERDAYLKRAEELGADIHLAPMIKQL